jgi:hypothetical protein
VFRSFQANFRNFQPGSKDFHDGLHEYGRRSTGKQSEPIQKFRREVMKSTALKSICAAVILAGALALTSTANAAPQPHNGSSSTFNLRGTWTVQVQLVDCTTGNPLGSPFPSLLSFAHGGTLTETTSNPSFFPSERSPGHGNWSVNKNIYSAASTAFVTLNGALQMTQLIKQTITMGGSSDAFDSVAAVQFFDPNGNLIKSGCATATGARFK